MKNIFNSIFWIFQPKYPEVKIRYGKLLDPIFTFYCQNNPALKDSGWNDWTPPTRDKISEIIKKYREAWNKRSFNILRSIKNKTGLNFKHNLIDVYIVSGNNRQLSLPIVIKSGYSSDEFVEVLTHELIHQLFNDNSDVVCGDFFKEMFPNETETTQEHIVTFALLEYIYIEILGDISYINNSRDNSKNPDYQKAWMIVKDLGYNSILNNFSLKIKKGKL